ncbi:TetR/AcrR family transcriptional regulator [Endozoicomonas ascidiicola]|uniref:TetR/AcrR family transcriptional regulator n=1 Tax=Endozoicomonas ascidiicola TaxID=1698521 RepID=UPI00082F4EFD|nr:TetR/AcrR family transcriptional regulator [Endozoicomonas ascidiicola]
MAVIDTQPPKAGRIRTERIGLILKAAEAEFASHGFRGTTLQSIADHAGLPKANILYYFSNKQELYEAVLASIQNLWNHEFDDIHVDDDPAVALRKYIYSKVDVSRKYPMASRLFTSEIIHGGHQLAPALKESTRSWVNDKILVMQTWVDQGRMKAIDPMYLLFLIWGATQHYADYESQICAIVNTDKLPSSVYDQAAESICDVVLRGCGLKE